MEFYKEKDMRIILGKHNWTNELYAYDLGKKGLPKSGDYAIVQNRGDLAMVKVIMAGHIDDEYQKIITGHEKVKCKVLAIIPKAFIEKYGGAE